MTIHKTFSIKPSEIKKKWLVIDADGLVVSCGDGSIKISEIQPSGRKKMTLSSYLAGKEINTGDFLGIKN